MRGVVSSVLLLVLSLESCYATISRSPLGVDDLATTVPPLVDFQVQQPPAVPRTSKSCTVELFHHLFGNSYYQRRHILVEKTDSEAC